MKIVDPIAYKVDLLNTYNIELHDFEDIKDIDAVVFAVSHEQFKNIKLEDIEKMYNNKWNGYSNKIDEVAATLELDEGNIKYVLIDVKGMFDRKEAEEKGFLYWRL